MGLGLLRTFFLDYILVMLHEQCNYGQLPAAQLFSNVMRGNNTAANNMCCMRRSSQSLAKRNRAERIIDVLWTILRSGVLMSDQGRMSVTSQGSPFPVSLPPLQTLGQLPAAQLFSNVMRGNNTAANNMCCMRRSSQSLAKRNRAERIIDNDRGMIGVSTPSNVGRTIS